VEHEIRVRGRGRVQLPAYGLADAEHRVEKEISRLWPGTLVQVLDVARGEGEARIVEEFTVAYRLENTLRVEADSPESARAAAFRAARALLADSRYFRTEWESPDRP
jgi:hypothetical protein